jgi:ABC-type polysaccharide/polyol phosphate transport system ATPase subunit
MMDRIIIQVEKLTKIYRLYKKPTDRAKEALSPFKRKYHSDFFALKDVTFQVKQGETFGIIGRNGSGKSTLLKILTGVSTQTTGKVIVEGKVAALLELGAGFNMEMTGIENVYLNGTMQGFTREQIDAKMDSIISFADIGEFVNQPVKSYSSGMFVRLAFALAINIDPDVLIVDEALSVGDIFFQLKCYRKFEEFKAAGKTILFVTHDMNSVLKYCDRAMVLDEGVKLAEGRPKEMIDLYKKVVANLYNSRLEKSNTPMSVSNAVQEGCWKDAVVLNPNVLEYGDKSMEIFDYGMFDELGNISQSILKDHSCSIRMRVRILSDVAEPIFAMTIKDIKGNEIAGTNSRLEMIGTSPAKAGQVFEIKFDQTMILQGGQYFVSLGCTEFNEQGDLMVHHRLYDAISFHVVATKFVVGIFDMGIVMGVERKT